MTLQTPALPDVRTLAAALRAELANVRATREGLTEWDAAARLQREGQRSRP